MLNNIFKLAAVTAFALSLVAIAMIANQPEAFGGYTRGTWDSAGGYKVDGTAVIDGDGNITGSTNLTLTGDTDVSTLVHGGGFYEVDVQDDDADVSQIVLLTAANVCDNSIIQWQTGTTGSVVMPGATELIADCIPNVGDTKYLKLERASGTGATTLTASTSIEFIGNAIDIDTYSSTTDNVINAASEWWGLTFINSSGSVDVIRDRFDDAD